MLILANLNHIMEYAAGSNLICDLNLQYEPYVADSNIGGINRSRIYTNVTDWRVNATRIRITDLYISIPNGI